MRVGVGRRLRAALALAVACREHFANPYPCPRHGCHCGACGAAYCDGVTGAKPDTRKRCTKRRAP